MNEAPTGAEERLQNLIRSGEGKAAGAISIILYDLTPSFIMNVKGRKAVYGEACEAAATILKQELAKSKDNLYYRLKGRIDNYWNE